MDQINSQKDFWDSTYIANPQMYGAQASEPGKYAASLFREKHLSSVLELGSGHGRDTGALLEAGLRVTALDYSAEALSQLSGAFAEDSRRKRLTVVGHDVRQALPFVDSAFDACYSHMLYNMALSDQELVFLGSEVRRVLVDGGIQVYTVRHVGDAHFGAGAQIGQMMYENGGFIVHFFDRELVEKLASGFEILDISEFSEGALPRRLWRVTQRKI